MQKFELTINTPYKNLKIGDIINIKSVKDKQTVITVNKGRKEYILNSRYLNFLQLVSTNLITMDTLFINPENSYCIGKYGTINHLKNMTELGENIFNSHLDADDFIQQITHK